MPRIEHLRTQVVPGAYHHSWVQKDDAGNVVSRFDGFPTGPDDKPEQNPFTGWGKPLTVFNNRKMDGTQEILGTYSGSDADIKQRWDSGTAAMKQINANPPAYRGDERMDLDTQQLQPATNSNSVFSTLGKAMGFQMDTSKRDDSPGIDQNLLPDFTPPAPIKPVPMSAADPAGQASALAALGGSDGAGGAQTADGSPNDGDTTNGTGVDLAADLSDPANLTDADEAELTPDFASMNALLNGSEGAGIQDA